jgi:hypothetical protein
MMTEGAETASRERRRDLRAHRGRGLYAACGPPARPPCRQVLRADSGADNWPSIGTGASSLGHRSILIPGLGYSVDWTRAIRASTGGE